MNQEPVAITAAINAAITATLAILLFVGISPELVGALTLAATAWIGVVAAVVRARVTPVPQVRGDDAGVVDGGVVWTIVGILAIVALGIWILRAT